MVKGGFFERVGGRREEDIGSFLLVCLSFFSFCSFLQAGAVSAETSKHSFQPSSAVLSGLPRNLEMSKAFYISNVRILGTLLQSFLFKYIDMAM